MTREDKPFDLVIFGATSFVGKILSRYLLERHDTAGEGERGPLRFALAARSLHKLQALQRELGPRAAGLTLLQADADDENSLRALCAQGRVICSTVGPYALYGDTLVKACAQSGTDYCDLTGEVQWIRRMIHAHGEAAVNSGARIVHCCGFDSIPSDLGVWFLQREARARFGKPMTRISLRVKQLRGGLSGGTVASLLNVSRELRANPALRKELADPYSLCLQPPPGAIRQRNIRSATYDARFGAWTAPFVMAAINTRIVQRSHALSGWAYGAEFRYDEAMLTGRGWKGRMRAISMSSMLAAFMLATYFNTSRKLLERYVLPKPGEGPSEQAQRRGHFELWLSGESMSVETSNDRRLEVRVRGDRDPGYGSTAKMLGEAAACLAKDLPPASAGGPAGGFWTPASLLAEPLLPRLAQHAGVTFEVFERS